MNFYKRHLGDYARDAGHLTMLEHGAYTLLLDRYYVAEQPIGCREDAYRYCRARTDEERAAVDSVLREFFVSDGESFMNRRAEEEIAAAAAIAETNRAIALAREEKRRETRRAGAEHVGSTNRAKSVQGSCEKREPSQTPDSKTPSSEPEGSGATAPTDRDMVFANGVALLTAAGVKESNARSFLGAQCKAHGEAAVRAALERCAAEAPVQPVPWLQAVLGRPAPAGLPPCPHAEIEAAYRELLPDLPPATVGNDKRRAAEEALWCWVLTEPKSDGKPRAVDTVGAMEWVRWYFGLVRDDDWCMGRSSRSGGKTATLDYLLRDDVRTRLIEAEMQRRRSEK